MLKASEPQPKSRDNLVVDLCIIGAGPGGIALATAAAGLGQKVVLIEKHKFGGNSLNYGSVPATALHAAADRAHAVRTSAPFGIPPHDPLINRAALHAHITQVVEALAPEVSAERLTGLGILIIQAAGKFTDPRTITVGEQTINARRFVIATGSNPTIPDLAGLANITYLTTDTIFPERTPIDHLLIIGGGAAACELAQSHRRLGARVTMIARSQVLARFDPELAPVVRARLEAEGVVINDNTTVTAVEGAHNRVRLTLAANGSSSPVEGSHLLIACGRTPATANIGATAGKIALTPDGIKVNRQLRTTNRRVYAIGDCIGLPHSTHRAEYHAAQLVQALLYRKSAAINPNVVPTAIHTDPELAAVGLSEKDAVARGASIKIHRWPMRDNARAIALRATDGHIKVITDTRGTILGVSLVAKGAGELIQVWSLAIAKGLNLSDMTTWIAPYPSTGEIHRQSAIDRLAARSGQAMQRQWIKLLSKLG
jgi:pyruvate/2-oxoglutarate dehydrogenase complex dihydrolipoamide dehydrogenase (E3) component